MRATFLHGVLFPQRQSDAGPARRRRIGVGAVLSLALTVPIGLAPVAQALAPAAGPGRPEVPKPRSTAVYPVTALGAKEARDHVAASKAANAALAKRAAAERKATWPSAGTAATPLGMSAAHPARISVGGLRITVAPTGSATAAAAGQVKVDTLTAKAADAAGVHGVLLSATAADPGTVRLGVEYGAFAAAYGGGWSGRLRLAQLPSCALTTPDKAACRVQTPLASHNDIVGRSVTAEVTLSATAPVGTAGPTVLALAADSSGESPTGSGNHSATPLSNSSTWAAGSSSGAFSWSYGMTMPPAAAGPTPSLGLSYDSGRSDGVTAATNNQGTLIGEGFDLTSSYVERSYGSCDDDGQTDKQDLCWKYDNASLVLNGTSTELVKDDTSGKWRLKDDDASTVTHSIGADNGDAGDTGKDGAGEYWTVTTGDGTQYVFGLNKLPGAAAQRTNSVWTVPVFGDDSGEPGYADGTAFSGRALNQAWRWNLDYVVDLHGNAMSYWYTTESNYYAKNGASTGTASYARGGYLAKILYGQRSDTLFTGTASNQVVFSYNERCTAADCSSLTKTTAPNWPDVPFDSICASGASCDATGPAFFTRKRLTKVETFSGSTPVDAWALTQQFLDSADLHGEDQTLVLGSILHTGENGTAIPLPPVTFTYQPLANRVDAPDDDILPLDRQRIDTITSETGAITRVLFSGAECVRGSAMPAAEDNNSKNCFPQYWHINGAQTAGLDWFHKYRVLSVSVSDPTGQNEQVISSYSYADPGWHHNDDPLTPEDERTWSQWRGYGTVTVTSGSAVTKSKTVSVYMQGMDGDKLKGAAGTPPRSATVTGVDFPNLNVADQTDSDPYAGFLREQITYDGAAPVSVTVNDPWSQNTATQHKSYADTAAYYVRTAKSATHTYLSVPGTWRTRTTASTFDAYGMPVTSDDAGDTAKVGDETCTRTWYARNTADGVGITSLVSRTRMVGQPCSVAETGLSLPTSSATRGDVLSDTATVYDGTTATAWSATQTPTKGEANWTGRATAYPATATGGERYPTSWQTVGRMQYDTNIAADTVKLGRARIATDALGNSTTTDYTPTGVGPLTKTTVTNALGQKSYTYLDPGRGATLKSYDVDLKITENSYDALGRITATWLPNRSRAATQSPTYVFGYSVSPTTQSWVSTGTLRNDGQYNTGYAIYDALLRPLQTQSPSPTGGRLLTDTRYDSRGLAYETFADVYDSGGVPNGTYARALYGGAPKQTDTTFDGAGRPVTSTFYVFGTQKWSTTSSYTGDGVATTTPAGGSATRTITDAQGRTTQRRQYGSTSPADTDYGAGVGAAFHRTLFTYQRDGLPATITGPDTANWSYVYDLFGRQISATDPDKGTATSAYTALDQVLWTKDARGTIRNNAYDALGRVTGTYDVSTETDPTRQIAADQLTGYVYDSVAKGQITSSTRYVGGNVTGGKAYTRSVTAYDSLDRATASTLTLASNDPLVSSGALASSYDFSTYYNIDGTQQFLDEPAAGGLPHESIGWQYNNLGLPTSMNGSTQYVLGTSYNELGQLDQTTLGTSDAEGIKHAFLTNTYEEGTDRLKQSQVNDQTHAYTLQNLNYTYDDAGDVKSITDQTTLGGTSQGDNQCFTYDGYQRLTEAWTPATPDCASSGRTTANLGGDSPYWTSYAYQSSGMRASETSHAAGGNTVRTYCYNSGKPHALTAIQTATTSCTGVPATYIYDPTGNTTTRPDGAASQSLVWDQEGHLANLTETTGSTTSTTKYLYDADGSLLLRSNASGETVLYLDAVTEIHIDASIAPTKTWGQRTYAFGGAGAVAARTNKPGMPTLTWLAGDQHGTSTLAINDSGQTLIKRYTTPFGAARPGGTGTWPDDKSFLGAPADPATSLTHLGAREYDPTTGRFISVDPLLTTADDQSLNGFTYADNNPASLADPSGECPVDLCGGGEGKGGSTTGEVTKVDQGSSVYDRVPFAPRDTNGNIQCSDTCQIFPGVTVPATPKWKSVVNKVADKFYGLYDQSSHSPEYLLDWQTNSAASASLWLDMWHACAGKCPTSGSMWMQAVAAGLASGWGANGRGGSEVTTGGKCSFSPDTPVLMDDGKTKPIGKIKNGDKVEAADPATGEYKGPRKVLATWINHDNNLTDVTIDTGDGHTTTIHTTSNHPFYDKTSHTWTPAGALTPGHTLQTPDNQTLARVTTITPTPGTANRYNLTVDELHMYYVLAGDTPVLVHNSGGAGSPNKGNSGTRRLITELEAKGYTIRGTEISARAANGVTVRFDVVAENNGVLHLFDAKNGPRAMFTKGQGRNGGYASIESSGGTWYGPNAEAAGLQGSFGANDVKIAGYGGYKYSGLCR